MLYNVDTRKRTAGILADAFAVANGDPNKHQNYK
jgi:hypothetical protein